MATRERRAKRGREHGRQADANLGRAYRLARRAAGVTQQRLSELVGVSQGLMSRIERGAAHVDLLTHGAIAEVLGLRLSVAIYPAGSPVRDAGHVRLFMRLQARLPGHFRWRAEVPIPRPGDLRAIDAMITVPRLDVGFEVESRLMDAQALVRRVILKQRDAGLACVVLVFADTVANRDAVTGAAATLRASFPLEARTALAALRQGEVPTDNAILFV